ncbi:MAG: HPr kinase/phosphatase C-terminal domain-containing protein [Salinarimonas sp.]|nr:HPr kinase/phosphatase C-terminal domain-containing protein [Salinarimonas sp.]
MSGGASDTIHASALVIGEGAIILRGEAGSGKTRLALALIERAQRAGRFARLVADDRVRIRPRNGRLIVSAPETILGHAEMRGAGIATDLPFISAARVRLVVDLDPAAPRHPPDGAGHVRLCAIRVAHLRLRREDAVHPIELIAGRDYSENAFLE